jgi:DNA-binding NtrC family response regulator
MKATFTERKILLVDDDRSIRLLISGYFRERGYFVEEADSCAAAAQAFASNRPDIAVADFRLPDGTALDLLPKLKELEPAIPIVVLTGYGSIELGASLIRSGAEQCLNKPIEMPALFHVIQKVLENSRNQQKQLALHTRQGHAPLDPFLGESVAIRKLAETAERLANGASPVLLQGETGTGKGVLARWLHENGPRAEEPFVDLNCAGLSREFMESELFGYEKGAFTGAVNPKPGLLDVGHRGTLFLDEIGDIENAVQPKLLKVVEEKKFRRLGDVRDRFVDVRLIAATHQNLQELIANKMFRSDLYFRISTVPIVIPPLRERPQDIPYIAQALLTRICTDMARPQAEISSRAMQRLGSYYWPGNIREMRNVLERARLLNDGAVLEPGNFMFEAKSEQRRDSYESTWTLEQMERFHIQTVFSETSRNVEQSAKRLGIAKSTLYQKLKTLQLD